MDKGRLVLGRKPGQQLLIGNDTIIEIGRIKGKHVSLIVTAPKSTPLLRGELARKESAA